MASPVAAAGLPCSWLELAVACQSEAAQPAPQEALDLLETKKAAVEPKTAWTQFNNKQKRKAQHILSSQMVSDLLVAERICLQVKAWCAGHL